MIKGSVIPTGSGNGSSCGLSRWENTQHLPRPNTEKLWSKYRASVQDGGGELMGPCSCASLVAVQGCVSGCCSVHAPPNAMTSRSSQELGWDSLCLSASSPAGPFAISKVGCKSFEAEACDSDTSKAMPTSGATCSTKINKPKES